MNRPRDPALRQKLLERAVQYVLQHGVGGVSLRPMAKAMGTTARMLMHHFGSKETLLAAVLVAIEQSVVQRAVGSFSDDRSVRFTVNRMWSEMVAPALDSALRGMFEVWGHALVHPSRYASLLESLTEPWIDLLRRRFERAGLNTADARTRATLVIGAFQGLQLVRLTSGDDARSTAALNTLMQWLDPPAAPSPKRKQSS